jgi:transcriptional regulator with GAF, ATPase, and Fis domain
MSAKLDREKTMPSTVDPLDGMAQETSVEAVLDVLADILEKKTVLRGFRLTQSGEHREFKVRRPLTVEANDYELKIDVKGGQTQLSIHLDQPVDDEIQRYIRNAAHLAAQRIDLLTRAALRSERTKYISEASSSALAVLVGDSPLMVNLKRESMIAARCDSTVLIEGETGTGKELVAGAIHRASGRAKGHFVPVNCGAFPENLIEDELFGHERGAFTGADKLRKGKFELAHGGTLFLDEVGELTLNAQVKLLRVLQEREFTRVGGSQTIRADVRVIAATNRDLWCEVLEGRFREDLYHRLNVLYLKTPALREHPEDIPLIIASRLEAIRKRQGFKHLPCFEPGVLDLLCRCPWPGNVRALENAVERLTVRAGDGEVITAELAKWEISECKRRAAMINDGRSFAPAETDRDIRRISQCEPANVSNGSDIAFTAVWHPGEPVQGFFDGQLLSIYRIAVNFLGGNHSEVARFLGIDRKTLLRWVARAEQRVKGA